MPRTLALFPLLLAACGASPGAGAAEPTLAEAARPLTASLEGELTPPCERMVFAFRPEERGSYRFEASAEVPLALRLFSMSPDLYIATGRREGTVSSVSADLEPGTEYALTVTPAECRAVPYRVAVGPLIVSADASSASER